MTRTLAVDYGRQRIGLALCDPLGLTVRPIPALQHHQPAATYQRLRELCEEESVEQIVIGLPLEMSGKEGLAVQEMRRFRTELEAAVGIPVVEQDERLTSRESHALLKQGGVRAKQRKDLVDSTAAVLLLKSFLQRLKRGDMPVED